MSILSVILVFAVGVIVGLVGNVILQPLKARRDGPYRLLLGMAALALFLVPAIALGITPGQADDIPAASIYLTGVMCGAILHTVVGGRHA